MGKHGRFEQRKTKKQMTGGKIALILAAVLLVLVIAAEIIGIVYYNSKLDNSPSAERMVNSLSQEEIDALLNYNPDAPVKEAINETTAASSDRNEGNS